MARGLIDYFVVCGLGPDKDFAAELEIESGGEILHERLKKGALGGGSFEQVFHRLTVGSLPPQPAAPPLSRPCAPALS